MATEVASLRAEVDDITRRVSLIKEAVALQRELEAIKKEIAQIQAAANNQGAEKEKKEKEEKEKKEREERERKEKEQKVKEEAERKAKEDQERKAKEEQEKKAKEEQERKAKEEQEKKAKEEQEKKAKEEQERKAKEAAQQKQASQPPAKTSTTTTATAPAKTTTTTTAPAKTTTPTPQPAPAKTTTTPASTAPAKTTTTTTTAPAKTTTPATTAPAKTTTTATPAKTTAPAPAKTTTTTSAPAKQTPPPASPVNTSAHAEEQRKKQVQQEQEALLAAKTRMPEKSDNRVAATYNPELEKEARQWITDVTGEKLEGSLGEVLKNGVILCKLVNKLKANIIPKIKTQKMPFMMMENINNFIKAAAQLGVPAQDMFQTVDLFEEKNMNQVVVGLLALGRQARKIPGYTGPAIGPKMSDKHEVQFTEEQLKKGLNELNFAQKSQQDSQKTVSETRRPAMDNVTRTGNTGTTTSTLGLLDKDKAQAQKEANSANLMKHNIIK